MKIGYSSMTNPRRELILVIETLFTQSKQQYGIFLDYEQRYFTRDSDHRWSRDWFGSRLRCTFRKVRLQLSSYSQVPWHIVVCLHCSHKIWCCCRMRQKKGSRKLCNYNNVSTLCFASFDSNKISISRGIFDVYQRPKPNRIFSKSTRFGSIKSNRTESNRQYRKISRIESNRTELRLIEDRIWPNRILCSDSRTESNRTNMVQFDQEDLLFTFARDNWTIYYDFIV